jgi:hypothetical protein
VANQKSHVAALRPDLFADNVQGRRAPATGKGQSLAQVDGHLALLGWGEHVLHLAEDLSMCVVRKQHVDDHHTPCNIGLLMHGQSCSREDKQWCWFDA